MTVLSGPPLSEASGVGALTLGGFLTEVAARHGRREALVFDDPLLGGRTVRWSYADLLVRARQVAAALTAGGCPRNSRVAILMGNRPEAVAALFGAAMAGTVAVPLSTFAPPAELRFLLADAGIDTVLTQTRMRDRSYAAEVGTLAPDLPLLRRVVAVGEGWDEFIESGKKVDPCAVDARARHIVASDEGLIIYSSGTTSQPKGVRHCHQAVTLQFWLQAGVFGRHPLVRGDTAWNMPVAYGLSETCTGFASHRSDTPRELLRASSGRLLPGNRLRVVDPDDGRELGPGEIGELTISGPTLMLGYVGRDARECFDGAGFFRTGDLGFFDDEGYVHWTGRRSEMIKTGGASVSPAGIEVALRAFAPLKLARVLGVPDERLGQIVVLCAVLKDGARAEPEEVVGFLEERVSSYKIPKRVLFFTDGEIPMTASDTKVRDSELLSLVQARLSIDGVRP